MAVHEYSGEAVARSVLQLLLLSRLTSSRNRLSSRLARRRTIDYRTCSMQQLWRVDSSAANGVLKLW